MNKKMLKKSLAVGFSGAMLGALVACMDSSDTSSTGPDTKDVEETSSSSLQESSSSAKSSAAKSSSSGKVTSSSSSKPSKDASSSSQAITTKATNLDEVSSTSQEEVLSSSSEKNVSSSSFENSSSSSLEEVSSSSEKECKPQEYKEGEFQTWIGDACNPRVNTGLDNGSEASGFWFSYGDDGDGGKSRVEWPVELGTETSSDAMDPVIAHCGGVCGTAALEKGSLTYKPFLGIGFNVAGESASGDPEPADASEWGGLCVSYKMDLDSASIELGLGDYDSVIGYANPRVVLLKGNGAVTTAVKWSDFEQPAWYKGAATITGEQAAKQLVSVKFKMQAPTGKYKFNIMSIGPLNGDCRPTDN